MQLTDKNYFSQEADKHYMSVSQFKSFLPKYGGCEAKAMAKINGTYREEPSDALLIGSYVHSFFEGTLEEFKSENKQIFTQKGELKAQYKLADEMIKALDEDSSFKSIYQGEKEKIYTFDLFGTPWKIKSDLFNPKEGYFIDLKTVKDFENQWSSYEGKRVTFVEAWGYIIQMAVYKAGLEACTGIEGLEAFIVAVTKQNPPDKMVLTFLPQDYEEGLAEVESYLPHILEVKNGIIEPIRCNKCDYCRKTKKLNKAVHYTELYY